MTDAKHRFMQFVTICLLLGSSRSNHTFAEAFDFPVLLNLNNEVNMRVLSEVVDVVDDGFYFVVDEDASSTSDKLSTIFLSNNDLSIRNILNGLVLTEYYDDVLLVSRDQRSLYVVSGSDYISQLQSGPAGSFREVGGWHVSDSRFLGRHYGPDGYAQFISIFDLDTLQTTQTAVPGSPYAVSPDRRTIILSGAYGTPLYVASPEDFEDLPTVEEDPRFITIPDYYGYWDIISSKTFNTAHFVGSSIFIAQNTDYTWDVMTRDGTVLATHDFRMNDERIYTITFSRDFHRAAAWRDGAEAMILDTTEFRDWLLERSLLFRPTTGVLTIGRVRIRRLPNLNEAVLGHLEEGDEVEVLDRSGLEMTIGEMTDYWYRVRRVDDGLEGWAYGAFIDLAEEQGPIPPVE